MSFLPVIAVTDFNMPRSACGRWCPRMPGHASSGHWPNITPRADWAPQMFRAKSTFAALAQSGEEAYALSVGVTGPDMRARLFSDELGRALQGQRAENRYVKAMRDAPARDPLDRAQYADLKIWLPADILTKSRPHEHGRQPGGARTPA